MNLYKSLARVYHEMYQNLFDYDAEYDFYKQQLQKRNTTSLVEFGCGTGNLASRFLKDKFNYCGVDLNEEMLMIAKENLPTSVFHQSDIANFSSDNKFQAALMTGRTISYLTENKHLIKSFRAIHSVLEEGGILIFDAIDAQQMFVDFDFTTKTLLANGYKRVSYSKPNLESGWTWNWFADYYKVENEAENQIGTDEAVLRAFTADEIQLLLEMTGFELLEIIKKETYTWNDNYFVAKKK